MDYYEILGVLRNDTSKEIKKAYRKLAMQFHPDRNPGDKEAENQFKKAHEAYEILMDVNKRARYNNQRSQSKPQAKPKSKKPFEANIYKDHLHICDAPPPKFDIWGKPLSPAEKAAWAKNNVSNIIKINKEVQEALDGWKDSYFDKYENSATPDIR